jgi:hypothetical protein
MRLRDSKANYLSVWNGRIVQCRFPWEKTALISMAPYTATGICPSYMLRGMREGTEAFAAFCEFGVLFGEAETQEMLAG